MVEEAPATCLAHVQYACQSRVAVQSEQPPQSPNRVFRILLLKIVRLQDNRKIRGRRNAGGGGQVLLHYDDVKFRLPQECQDRRYLLPGRCRPAGVEVDYLKAGEVGAIGADRDDSRSAIAAGMHQVTHAQVYRRCPARTEVHVARQHEQRADH